MIHTITDGEDEKLMVMFEIPDGICRIIQLGQPDYNVMVMTIDEIAEIAKILAIAQREQAR